MVLSAEHRGGVANLANSPSGQLGRCRARPRTRGEFQVSANRRFHIRSRSGPVLAALILTASVFGPATPAARAAVGAALQFSGSGQYVTFGQASGLNATNFTLEAWVNWTGGGVGTSTGGGGIANAIPVITKGRAEVDTPANLNMDYFL